jgi:glycosyltransferase involved in cell wall biosynthesis
MKFGIIIATYQRLDGTTPFLLTRAINSIKQQTYQNYKLIIIGDRYENNDEFEKICNDNLDIDISYFNLPIAKERDRYPIGSKELWCAGGVNARNTGIDILLNLDVNYICHLDHDDYWHPTHLEQINRVLTTVDNNASFIYSCSTYFDRYLPNGIELNNSIINSSPRPGDIIHSSVCINYKNIPLRYQDVYAESGNVEAADANLWSRIYEYIHENMLSSYLISAITCFHPTENQ